MFLPKSRDIQLNLENNITLPALVTPRTFPSPLGNKRKSFVFQSWKKRWVVLQQMSNMSEGTYAAKIDVFPDEVSSYKSPSDKFTLFLENVRAVQPAKSKKRAHAFEIVENEAVLLMAGETELESQTWVWTIRKIFWPNEYLDSEGGTCFYLT